jgi:hypothetical protein
VLTNAVYPVTPVALAIAGLWSTCSGWVGPVSRYWSICCLTLELAQQRHEIKCTKRADRCFATPLGTETLYAGISVRLNHCLKLWVSNAFREIFQVHIHISSAGNEQLLVPLSCHQRRIMTTADRVLRRQVKPCQYSGSRICADTFWSIVRQALDQTAVRLRCRRLHKTAAPDRSSSFA